VPGGIILTFQAVSNRSYVVYYRDVVGGAAWTNLAAVAAAPTNRQVRLTNAPPDVPAGTPERYYRLHIPTSP
jgi:hypothetical protein